MIQSKHMNLLKIFWKKPEIDKDYLELLKKGFDKLSSEEKERFFKLAAKDFSKRFFKTIKMLAAE